MPPKRFTKTGRRELAHSHSMFLLNQDAYFATHADEDSLDLLEKRLRSNWHWKEGKQYVKDIEAFKFVDPGRQDAIHDATNPEWSEWRYRQMTGGTRQ